MKQRIEKTELETAIEIWKKLNIDCCEMEFSCGGDSMNDYSFTFYAKDQSKPIATEKVSELKHFFEEEVFNNVEFYVNSDGHYMGEAGIVTITLYEDEDGFSYDKEALAEYSEAFNENTEYQLNDDEAAFIKEYVQNINGTQDGINFNFKKDFILTKLRTALIENLGNKLKVFCMEYELTKEVEGEQSDYETFTMSTDIESEDELKIDENNVIKINIEKYYTVQKDEY